MAVYFFVWIGHSLFAFYKVALISNQYAPKLDYLLPSRFANGSLRDASNFEWELWVTHIPKWLLLYLGHFCTNLGTARISNASIQRYAQVSLWISLHMFIYGVNAVLVVCAIALTCLFISRISGSIFPVWLLCAYWLFNLDHFLETSDHSRVYLLCLLYTYKIAQIISYCDDSLHGNRDRSLLADFADFLHYAFYPPYTVLLIVTYSDFTVQYGESRAQSTSRVSLLFEAVRFLLWLIVAEAVLHVCFMNAFMLRADVLGRVDLVGLVAIGYAAGQFFHLKYRVLFGLAAWWARLDGLQPPAPPVCIARVSLYSRMWRHFDRGLYRFLRRHVYERLGGTDGRRANVRRLFAGAAAFGFVLAWHGVDRRHVCWVALNVVELLLEAAGRALLRRVGSARLDAALSRPAQRRLLALLQNAAVAFGVFAIFYFLGEEGVGDVFGNRIWWQNGARLNHVLWYLLALGYCFNNCCMEFDRWHC